MRSAPLFTSLYVAGIMSTGMIVGCGRSDAPAAADSRASEQSPAGQAPAAGMPEHGQDLTVTGCLTANIDGQSYALTPSDTSATPAGQSLQVPGRETLTYELVGNVEDFRRYANTVVTARGRADASARREAEMERKGESEQQPAAGTKDTPTVETKEEVEVNVQRLHVTSIVGSGNACPSLGQGGGGRATEAPGAGAPKSGAATSGAPKGGTPPRPEGGH